MPLCIYEKPQLPDMNTPYSILPIGVLTLILYLLTYILSKLHLLKPGHHRQIWNVLLLLSFFGTAFLGLLLAIKVNYKLKLEIGDQLMIWHVDFGLAMAMIAIFHLSWHLTYYLKLFSGKQDDPVRPGPENILPAGFNPLSSDKLQVSVVLLGFTSLITQVICLREFLSVFNGNELVAGTVLANWMVLTGLGASLGRIIRTGHNHSKFTFYALIFTALLPLITVILLNVLKSGFFGPGVMNGITQIFFFSLLLLTPFCLLSGFLFTHYSSWYSGLQKTNQIERVYSLEAVGSLLAGLLYSFLLIFFLRSLQTLALLLLLNILVAVFFFRKEIPVMQRIILSLSTLGILFFVFFTRADILIKKDLFPNQEILSMKDTPFGNLTVTKSSGQVNFFENLVLTSGSENITGAEETVHFPMLQHPSPSSVLLIGGGIGGEIREILKYSIKKIDYVEMNPWMIQTGKKYNHALNDTMVSLVQSDARTYIRNTNENYDVVIIQMPSPTSAQVNRFYTLEFFRELKGKLNPGAMVSFGLPSTENYVSEAAADVQSVIYNTLSAIFRNIILLPGDRNYFIASDSMLSKNIVTLAEQKQPDAVYVNSYYLDDKSLEQRSNMIMSRLEPDTPLNRDFRPVAYLMETGYWLSHFNLRNGIILIIGLAFMSLFVINRGRTETGLFITGFSSASAEVMILFAFQLVFGYMYHASAVIITVFMAGLATGAALRKRMLPEPEFKDFRKIQFIQAGFLILIPVMIYGIKHFNLPYIPVYLIFFISTAGIALLTGMQFSVASLIKRGEINAISGRLYSSDLFGSALGAFLVSVFLFPVTGLFTVFLILAGLNLGAAILQGNFTGRSG